MIINRPFALALTFALALGPGLALAQSHAHSGHEATELALVLNDGAKWQGDQNMIDGMTAIRDTMATNLSAIHNGTLSPDAASGVAAEVQKQVDFMIENCELEPAADEQFHGVLAQVADGAVALEEGEVQTGGVRIVEALNAYGDHFVHPGWQKLE